LLVAIFIISEACSSTPKYIPVERWVPKEWTHVHRVYRQDDLGEMAELYHFVTPEDSLVRAEVEKIDWQEHGYDQELNKVLSVVNHVRGYRKKEKGSFNLPREVIEAKEDDCTGLTALGISMLIKSGINEDELFFAVGHIGFPQSDKKHAWGEWRRPDKSYILEFASSQPLLSLPSSTLTDKYYPKELANRLGSIVVEYDRIR